MNSQGNRDISTLRKNEDIRICDDMEKRWKDIVEKNIKGKGEVHALR